MIVIPIGIGTLFGLWLVVGLAYLALGAVVAIVTGIAGLFRRLVPPSPEKEAARREIEVTKIIEELKNIGCPPDRAGAMAQEIVSGALAPRVGK